MKSFFRSLGFYRSVGLLILGASPFRNGAQSSAVEEQPRWMRLRISGADVGTEVEAEREERTTPGSPTVTRERLYVAPTVGLAMQGSFYHPNLFKFALDAQDGIAWETEKVTSPGLGGSLGNRESLSFLQRYHATASILQEKPYAGSIFADKDHTFRDYDFFTRVTVDSEREGGQVGFSSGPVPFSISVSHLNEDITGLVRPSHYEETPITLNARNERVRGRTDLNYMAESFLRTEPGIITQEGFSQNLSLNDTEALGKADKMTLNSGFTFNQLDTESFPTSGVLFQEQLITKHRDDLQSALNYSYDNHSVGEIENQSHVGRAELRHQLFESLTSTFNFHGEAFDASGGGADLDTLRYGVGINESYSKRLGTWGHLTIGDDARVDHEDRNSMGGVLVIVREPHTLTDGTLTFLNMPLVDPTSIRVTDALGLEFVPLLDYIVEPHGDLMEIRRIPGGTGRIPNGGQVFVDYRVTSQPSDSYETVANQASIRLDLFNHLLGFYGRINVVENYGGHSLILQNIYSQIVGTDVNWQFVRAGAEYERFDSNLAPYRTKRLYESFFFEPPLGSTLSFDFTQNWTDFLQADRTQTSYSFIGRYSQRLTAHFLWHAEGGVRMERGRGFDQDLATARTGFDFRYGQLLMQLSYDYQHQDFLGELRGRHFLYFRVRRTLK